MPLSRGVGAAAAALLATSCGPPQAAPRSLPAATVPAREASSPRAAGGELVAPEDDSGRRPPALHALADACSLLPVAAVESLLGGPAEPPRPGPGSCAWSAAGRTGEVRVAVEAISDLRVALERYQAATDVHEAVSGIADAALVSDPGGESARIAVFGAGWQAVVHAPGRSTPALAAAAGTLAQRLAAGRPALRSGPDVTPAGPNAE